MTRRSRRRPASTSSPSRQVFSLAAAERLEVRTAFTCNMPTQENTLDPLLIHKYENPLPNPLDSASVYRPSSVSTAYGVRNESYTVGMYRTTQDILGNVDVMGPDGTSVIGTTHFRTPIYGYGTSQATASFPGKTFVVPQNTNVSVHWVNQLGTVANYLMNPYMDGSDMMNTPDMMAMPANDGVPTVPHLHGGHTESGSDGQPDQWFTQALPETPGGRPVIDRGPQAVKANDTYVYDASVNATAHEYWYHDHALGYTRTNVYAGLAGLYFTRDSLDTGTAANKLGLPSGKYEVPLMIADKMFTPDGQLYYPHQVDPSGCVRMLPEAFGDVMTVNGKAWPVMHVEPRAYRFRMLDGCDSRFLNLWLARDTDTTLAPAATLMQVGTDQGLLARPVAQQKLLLGPGERADIVVDFSKFAPGTKLVMRNDAPTPYDGGDPVDPATTGQVMEFIVDAPLTRSCPTRPSRRRSCPRRSSSSRRRGARRPSRSGSSSRRSRRPSPSPTPRRARWPAPRPRRPSPPSCRSSARCRRVRSTTTIRIPKRFRSTTPPSGRSTTRRPTCTRSTSTSSPSRCCRVRISRSTRRPAPTGRPAR